MIKAIDPRVLDKLANDPDILPYVSPNGEPLDLSGCFAPGWAERNRFFHNEAETIGMFFQWTAPLSGGGAWALHMMAKPETHGGQAMEFATAVIRHMFFTEGAEVIWGETPTSNERARKMHSKVGGISRGFGTSPLFGEVELFSTARDEWKPFEPKYSAMKPENEEVNPSV